jgi:hypothetical protein
LLTETAERPARTSPLEACMRTTSTTSVASIRLCSGSGVPSPKCRFGTSCRRKEVRKIPITVKNPTADNHDLMREVCEERIEKREDCTVAFDELLCPKSASEHLPHMVLNWLRIEAQIHKDPRPRSHEK